MAEKQSDIRVQVKPFQVIAQMQPYDWDIALGSYAEVMGETASREFIRMLSVKLQAWDWQYQAAKIGK